MMINPHNEPKRIEAPNSKRSKKKRRVSNHSHSDSDPTDNPQDNNQQLVTFQPPIDLMRALKQEDGADTTDEYSSIHHHFS